MRSSFAPRGGFVLMKTPSPRAQTHRRWLAALTAMVVLALASGLIGTLTSPDTHSNQGAVTGPLSYIPAS